MSSLPERVAFGDFIVERSQRRLLRRDGGEIALTPRLFDALLLFVERPGELLDRDTLMKALWPRTVVEDNNLNQVVSGLRRALGDDAQGSRFIRTVPKHGFRFIGEVATLDAATTSAIVAPAADGRRRQLLQAGVGAGLIVAAVVGAGWMWRRRRAAETSSATTLAVLPFQPLTGQGTTGDRDALLELGMADSLITRLSTVPGLVVRSTSAVRRYGGPGRDPLRAARELDAAWVIDGSLMHDGDALRVSARLLRVADGVATWSGAFEERYTSVFEVQQQIADRVANALAATMTADARTIAHSGLVDPGGTHSTDAYQLYLAATRRLESGRADGLAEGIALLERALVIDPRYASAWTALALAHRRGVWNADAKPIDAHALAWPALQRALAIAPRLAFARTLLGSMRYFHDRDWDGAESEFRGVLAHNPSVAVAHFDLSRLLLTQGHLDEGFAHARLARELDPSAPLYNTVEASFLLGHGRLGEARLRLERSLTFAPNLWLSHVALGLLLVAEKRPDEGVAALRRAVALTDATTRPLAVLGMQLALLGQADEARAILRGLQDRSQARYVPPTSIAMVQAATGENGAALDALEEAVAVHDPRVADLHVEPGWRPLRGEPRFVALLKKLKLDGYGLGLAPV